MHVLVMGSKSLLNCNIKKGKSFGLPYDLRKFVLDFIFESSFSFTEN